jgi:hypothetical protein
MLMIQKYVLLQKAAQEILYGILYILYYVYSCENSIALLTHIQSSTASRAILSFVKQWIVFNTCNINNYCVTCRL